MVCVALRSLPPPPVDVALSPHPAALPRAAVREAVPLYPRGPWLRSGYVVPIRRRVLRPHPSVSPARGDFTDQPLIRRAFAVRERRGGPRDLPYFRCCAFHTCRRPCAGGSEAPTRCVRAPLPGFLVLSLSRHPPHPSLPALPDGVMLFGAASFASCCGPCVGQALLTGYDDAKGQQPSPRLQRTVSPPLFTRRVTTSRRGARWANGKFPIVGTFTQPVTAASEAAR